VWGEPQIKMIGNFWVLPRASLSSAAEAQVSFVKILRILPKIHSNFVQYTPQRILFYRQTRMSKKIETFVESLARTKPTRHSVNPYSYEKKQNDIRRRNLAAYLTARLQSSVSVLLVGEAPGYRGTRRTGVPFSSEKIILTHPFFTSRKEFSIENGENPIAESSASIVWKTMDELQFFPLIWASFPFHPHQPGNKESNRPPTKAEILTGQTFLQSLLEIFEITTVVAVGRAAEKTLGLLHIPATCIRHPSHGGASLFRSGLVELVKTVQQVTRVPQSPSKKALQKSPWVPHNTGY
jgi:uracil-DNA glycosylase